MRGWGGGRRGSAETRTGVGLVGDALQLVSPDDGWLWEAGETEGVALWVPPDGGARYGDIDSRITRVAMRNELSDDEVRDTRHCGIGSGSTCRRSRTGSAITSASILTGKDGHGGAPFG